MKRKYIGILFLPLAVFLVCLACTSGTQTNNGELVVTFADEAWDGETVPKGQQCQRFEGVNPATPSLAVENIPKGTEVIIMEFSDKSYEPMSNGGHGKVGYTLTKKAKQVVIPSCPGHTLELPENFFVVEEHQAPGWDIAGAYLPPCSGGGGNTYAVIVKAAKKSTEEGADWEILASKELLMGIY